MQSAGTKFVFQCSETAKDMLMKEGLDFKYGARHLKRAVERFLVYPLSNLVATGQIGLGDLVHVDVDGVRNRLVFSKSSGGALIHEMTDKDSHRDPVGCPISAQDRSERSGICRCGRCRATLLCFWNTKMGFGNTSADRQQPCRSLGVSIGRRHHSSARTTTRRRAVRRERATKQGRQVAGESSLVRPCLVGLGADS